MSQRPQPKIVTEVGQKKPTRLVIKIFPTGTYNVNVREGKKAHICEEKRKGKKERQSFCPNFLWLLAIPCPWNAPRKAAKQEVEDKHINVTLSFSTWWKPKDYLLHILDDFFALLCWIQLLWDLAALDIFCMARFLASSEKRKGTLTYLSSSYRISVSSYLIIQSFLFYQMLAKLKCAPF